MIPAQFLQILNVPVQGNTNMHDSPQHQVTGANSGACVYVKGIEKLLIGFQRGIEAEEWAFHNSCTKAW